MTKSMVVFVPSHILAAFIYAGGVTLAGGVAYGAKVVGGSIPDAIGVSGPAVAIWCLQWRGQEEEAPRAREEQRESFVETLRRSNLR